MRTGAARGVAGRRPASAPAWDAGRRNPVLALQRALGNGAVMRLLEEERPAAHGAACPCAGCATAAAPVMRAVRTTASEGRIQRAPPLAFTALAPWPGGTAIPLDHHGRWDRPAWLRGAQDGAYTMRLAMAATLPVALAYEGQNFYRCSLCGKLGDLNGMSVDHRTDWRQSVAGSADRQQLEYRYHDLDNLHLVHNNCNSSKSQRDLFDWWRANVARHYMDVAAQQRVMAALDRVFATTGIDWLYEIPEDRRGAAASAVIEQAARQNAMQHLMSNAKLLSAIGGWKNAGPRGPGPDDEDGMVG